MTSPQDALLARQALVKQLQDLDANYRNVRAKAMWDEHAARLIVEEREKRLLEASAIFWELHKKTEALRKEEEEARAQLARALEANRAAECQLLLEALGLLKSDIDKALVSAQGTDPHPFDSEEPKCP